MDSEKAISIEGTIMSVLPGTMFVLRLQTITSCLRIFREKCANVLFA
jgi:translation initiation factor IF-1